MTVWLPTSGVRPGPFLPGNIQLVRRSGLVIRIRTLSRKIRGTERLSRIPLLANVASLSWLGVLALNVFAAATGRSDAAGEAMMAGCVLLATTAPLAAYSIVVLLWSRKAWPSLTNRLRFQLWANVSAIVVVYILGSLAWEFLSPY